MTVGGVLAGRATVQLTFEREGDGRAFVDKEGGGGKPQAQVTIELDGYSAPLTAGNFAANVLSGAYDGAPLSIGGETISITSSKLEGKTFAGSKTEHSLVSRMKV